MAVITVDKVVLIVVVTAIIIVLAYFFRFGRFSRKNQAGTNSDVSHSNPSDSSPGRFLQSDMKTLSPQAEQESRLTRKV